MYSVQVAGHVTCKRSTMSIYGHLLFNCNELHGRRITSITGSCGRPLCLIVKVPELYGNVFSRNLVTTGYRSRPYTAYPRSRKPEWISKHYIWCRGPGASVVPRISQMGTHTTNCAVQRTYAEILLGIWFEGFQTPDSVDRWIAGDEKERGGGLWDVDCTERRSYSVCLWIRLSDLWRSPALVLSHNPAEQSMGTR